MRLETYLNALVLVEKRMTSIESGYPFKNMESLIKRNRQYRAFRARILRMDAEKDEEIKKNGRQKMTSILIVAYLMGVGTGLGIAATIYLLRRGND